MARLTALLACFILTACALPQPNPRAPRPEPRVSQPEPREPNPDPSASRPAADAIRPELHISYQNVPQDGTGRLGGSAVDELTITRHDTVYWPTHVMAEAFYARTHDRFYREIDGKWVLREELTREYAALIDRLANACLDFCEEVAGGRPMAERVRVFVDIEHGQIDDGRWLYAEHERVRGYGSRDVRAMNLLCDHIELLGRKRWGVEVLAGPYMPIRPNGHWSGLRETPIDFVRDWRSRNSGAWPLLNRRIVWVHCYTPEDPAQFLRQHQTHRQFAQTNIRDLFNTILESGAQPEEVWVIGWFYTRPTALESEGIMRGLRDVLAERDWPWETHLAWAGGWGALTHLLDQPVERRQRSPLVLNIPADVAGRAIARAWIQEVEEPYKRVFGDAGGSAP